jgi:hypothetical protein
MVGLFDKHVIMSKKCPLILKKCPSTGASKF